MRKSYTIFELIITVILIAIVSSYAILKIKNLKEKSEIESFSKLILSGSTMALEAAINLYYLEGNQTFKLKDILHITQRSYQGLELKYTTYKKGSYSIRDTTNNNKVVMRVTLYLNPNMIEFVIDCSKLKEATHKKLKEICIKKWGDERIDEKISF
jgi:Tfp pilus assembly protein FimT